jgi:hypothetical protein
MQQPWLDNRVAANGSPVQLNFSRWFGQSRVVNADGTPMVVFHGTAEDVDRFDPSRAGSEKRSDWGPGVYFTPSAGTADYYRAEAAKKRDTTSNAIWALLEQEEAKTVWSNGSPTYTPEHGRLLDAFRAARRDAEDRTGCVMPVFLSIQNPFIQEYSPMPDPYLGEHARFKGHDGIFVLDGHAGINEIVAFKSEQIKSALGNNGLYFQGSGSVSDLHVPVDMDDSVMLQRALQARRSIQGSAALREHLHA